MRCVVGNFNSFKVTVSEREVRDFADRWPCFGPVKPVRFLFACNGDLMDGKWDDRMDPSGLAALAADAARYGLSILRRDA